MSSARSSSRSSERGRRRCPGIARWRSGARARAVLIVDMDGAKVLGPRFIRLLEEIHARGSMRSAAAALGLGYRHALGWVKRAEAVLERPLVVRRAGGVAGGGSGLTPEAIRLVRGYRRLSGALARVAARAEEEILGGRSSERR